MSASISGVGLSYRPQHHLDLMQISTSPDRPAWLEILADNFMVGGITQKNLEEICNHYPVVFHCVGMNLAGNDRLDGTYLKELKQLIDVYQPRWVSDHLCWTSAHGRHYHDLLPIPYTPELINHVSHRLQETQEVLQTDLLVENVSSYLAFAESEMTEAYFIDQVAQRSGCSLLLDVNNIYVNCHNFSYVAEDYIDKIKPSYIKQIHLAGHVEEDDILIDNHGKAPNEDVLNLYQKFFTKVGPTATCLEWDQDIPAYSVIEDELHKIKKIWTQNELA